MKKYNVAVMGATGLVGGTILNILEERNFPIENLYLFSSKKLLSTRTSILQCLQQAVLLVRSTLL